MAEQSYGLKDLVGPYLKSLLLSKGKVGQADHEPGRIHQPVQLKALSGTTCCLWPCELAPPPSAVALPQLPGAVEQSNRPLPLQCVTAACPAVTTATSPSSSTCTSTHLSCQGSAEHGCINEVQLRLAYLRRLLQERDRSSSAACSAPSSNTGASQHDDPAAEDDALRASHTGSPFRGRTLRRPSSSSVSSTIPHGLASGVGQGGHASCGSAAAGSSDGSNSGAQLEETLQVAHSHDGTESGMDPLIDCLLNQVQSLLQEKNSLHALMRAMSDEHAKLQEQLEFLLQPHDACDGEGGSSILGERGLAHGDEFGDDLSDVGPSSTGPAARNSRGKYMHPCHSTPVDGLKNNYNGNKPFVNAD